MINIPEEAKKLYRMNMYPTADDKAEMKVRIEFPELGMVIGNSQIVQGTFRLTESISENGDLDFGSCIASTVEMTVADVDEDITGAIFTVTHIVNGLYEVPLGTYRVDSCKKQDDLRFKDIVAYDNMRKFDVDVADWYNSLSFPVTVRSMRDSLCDYCGVEQAETELANDEVLVEQTIDASELKGREVLRAIAELNGAFAHIDRYGKLTYITIKDLGLYPEETLYPSEDLYPSEPTELLEKTGENCVAYISSKYEDYEVSAIDGVVIKDDEEASTGITVGEATNPYALESNMLVIGKSKADLTDIGERLLGTINEIVYIPHDTECIGLPYIEVGDVIVNATGSGRELLVTKRTMTGLSSVMDEFSAYGNSIRDNNSGVDSTEIRKLKGLTTKITKDIDKVGIDISNLETLTDTKFVVMDGRITSEVTRATEAEEKLSSKIEQTESRILLSVEDSLNDVYGKIELKLNTSDLTSEINLIADNIVLTGNTTFSNGSSVLSMINNAQSTANSASSSASSASSSLQAYKDACANGTTTISGGCIETGTLEASAIAADFFTTAGQSGSGWTIMRHPTSDGANYICGNDGEANNVVLKTAGAVAFACGLNSTYTPGMSTADAGATVQIYHNGDIKCADITVNYLTANYGITCHNINGYTPITTGNISSYIPTNTNQLTGDFQTGSNGTYVALANSSGNKYLATTEWVINYVASKLG